jgi:hypothetical protein
MYFLDSLSVLLMGGCGGRAEPWGSSRKLAVLVSGLVASGIIHADDDLR